MIHLEQVKEVGNKRTSICLLPPVAWKILIPSWACGFLSFKKIYLFIYGGAGSSSLRVNFL